MHLYLVRHGQSEGNVLRTFHGQTDYPLTPLGMEQARQSAEKLKGIPFTRCCASDLRRAWDTAQACVEGRGVAVEPCPALREQFVGEIEGLSWEEMGERHPGLRERYIEDWYGTVPPGGESPAEVAARVGACVDEILARGEDTLVVGHQGSLTEVLAHLGLRSREKAMDPEQFFGQGVCSAVQVGEDGAKLLFFNR